MPTFNHPSFRAAQSDLAISVSPLGLIELSDEEFEIHGPRLNRYANQWAMYLGHHWGYRREAGEPLLTFNYTRAFADYINHFSFGRGVKFKTPKATEAIIPALLDRVWNVDNHRGRTLWRMGQVGGVTGDAFIKVAYEDAYADPAGRLHPGRVRILPLNSSFCFPEFHPHDRERLIRFKLKYRFWGTAPDGTRQVFTYTEILTDDFIEEYINDEQIDQRKNPLGMIPVIHIPNMPVEGSPWGLSDINDILSLNREYNEKATDISDIINYHSEPVTIIKGAKASNLEKASNRVWAGLPKDADVFNLEMNSNLQGPLVFLETLKRGMHEMTGVPEGALGQKQAISNTSGVALAIEYQPMMQRYGIKTMQYGHGIERVNEVILLTLAIKEPEVFQFNAGQTSEIDAAAPIMLDPMDPIVYQTTCDFPPPLPTDELILLNELQVRMGLGMESKKGALQRLGEEFPDEKLAEIFSELREDMVEQGSLDLLRSTIQSLIVGTTGMMPDGSGPVPPAPGGAEGEGAPGTPPVANGPGGPTVTSVGAGLLSSGTQGQDIPMNPDELLARLVTEAFGTKLAQRRAPNAEETK
jgi:hypothetical protein